MIPTRIDGNVTIPENAAPTVLAGRYRVVRQLGQGGMGSAWLAEDMKLDGRKVAIKMLPSILVSNKRAYAQVKQEALVSLKLTHSNIVAVRAFEEECGSPFLVMDYIDGLTLDDYLADKGKLSEEETVKLLKPIADALDYAHSQGVVHRDVKPGNVMIAADGHPYILDFGIAREVQETMTRVTGKLSSGTLMYMSPEQLNGAAPKPSQDVYSFAAMVYECLKGAPPFSRGQIEYQIVNNNPEPLPRNIAICLSVMSGLKKTPEARPATCAAVLSVGSRVSRDHSSSGAPARKSRLAVVLLVVLAVGALVGGGWWWGRAQRGVLAERQTEIVQQGERHVVADEMRQTDEKRRLVEAKRVEETRIAADSADAERVANENRDAGTLSLKKEAERRLAPTLRIVAKIGDREVPAEFTYPEKYHETPFEWRSGLVYGQLFPKRNIDVAYAEGGKDYVGTVRQQKVDWEGLKTIIVALAEVKMEEVKGIDWKFTIRDGLASVGDLHLGPAVSTDIAGAIEIPQMLGGCTVTRIDASAFSGCEGLISVTIPPGVTNIGSGLFMYCPRLTCIEVARGNQVYSSQNGVLIDTAAQTIVACPRGRKSVVMPSGVTSIGEDAFAWCERLTSVAIPSSVTNIGNSAFYGCKGLTSVTIPSGVMHIGGNPFSSCSRLTRIEVEQGNKVYSSQNGVLVDKVARTIVACPAGCKSAVIPFGVTRIGDHAFSGCKGLTSLTIPNTVTSIGDSAFSYCEGLTSLTIPNSVTNIGDDAFFYCKGLSSVTIPSSVTSIGSGSFGDCSRLTRIEVEQGNRVYSSQNGVLLDKVGQTLVSCPVGCKSVVIPFGVTRIGDRAFSGCEGLTSVTIPNSVTSIEDETFAFCGRLTSMVVPSSVTRIGRSAFVLCGGLTSVTIPSSVMSIGKWAFASCENLRTVRSDDPVKAKALMKQGGADVEKIKFEKL